MAGLLVYLSGYTGNERAELERRGLGGLVDPECDTLFHEVRNGPDAGLGMLVTFYQPGGVHTPRQVDLETQEWLEAPPDGEQLPKGRYWLGYVKGAKPSAGELQRRTLIDGEPVLLGDGNAWVVPCCEYAPRRVSIDRDTGAETRVVKDEHRQWVEWSNAIYETIVSEAWAAITEKAYIMRVPGGLSYAALTLSKNYRVNRDVCDLLALFDEHELSDLILAATGVALVARAVAQKKSLEPSCPVAAAS